MRVGVHVVLALALALFVVGCGGDEGGEKDGTGEPAAGTASTGDGGGARKFVDRPSLSPVSVIERSLGSPNADVREDALRQIAELEDREAAIRLLERMVDDGVPELRTSAIEMLRSRGAKSSAGKLQLRLGSEQHPEVRAALVNAVAELGGPSSVLTLLAIAKDLDEAEPVRTRAIFALGEFKDEVALDGLHELVADLNGVIRLYAMDALGKIAAERSIAAIGDRVADDSDDQVRVSGARALATIGAKSATAKRSVVKYLVRALDTENPDLQSAAVSALRDLTGEAFGYDAMKTAGENAAAIEEWLAWWERVKSTYE